MTPGIQFAATLCDAAGSLLIAAVVVRAAVLAARRQEPRLAARVTAQAVLTGLTFKLAGTLLAILALDAWTGIGRLALLMVLRLALGRVFRAEVAFFRHAANGSDQRCYP